MDNVCILFYIGIFSDQRINRQLLKKLLRSFIEIYGNFPPLLKSEKFLMYKGMEKGKLNGTMDLGTMVKSNAPKMKIFFFAVRKYSRLSLSLKISQNPSGFK